MPRLPGDPDDDNPDDFDSEDWSKRLLGPSLGDQLDEAAEKFEREERELEGRYSKDWDYVSLEYRKSQDYTCESCGVCLREHKHSGLLHVHHIDGTRTNNEPHNLMALCVLCHGARHVHLQYEIRKADRDLILALRQRQTNSTNGNSSYREGNNPADFDGGRRAKAPSDAKLDKSKAIVADLMALLETLEDGVRKSRIEEYVRDIEAKTEASIPEHFAQMDVYYELKDGALKISDKRRKALVDFGCCLREGMSPTELVQELRSVCERKAQFDNTKEHYTKSEEFAIKFACIPRWWLTAESAAIEKRFILGQRLTGSMEFQSYMEFFGTYAAGRGESSKVIRLPGRCAATEEIEHWPAKIQKGTFNVIIDVDRFPEEWSYFFDTRTVRELDSHRFRPLAEIPANAIGGNTIQPTSAQPDRGNGQVWEARIENSEGKRSLCWVFRRIGSMVDDNVIELISEKQLSVELGFAIGDPVRVEIYGKWVVPRE
jgi:hypothetical protein